MQRNTIAGRRTATRVRGASKSLPRCLGLQPVGLTPSVRPSTDEGPGALTALGGRHNGRALLQTLLDTSRATSSTCSMPTTNDGSPLRQYWTPIRCRDVEPHRKHKRHRAARQHEAHAAAVSQQPREVRELLPVAKHVRQHRRSERARAKQQQRGERAEYLRSSLGKRRACATSIQHTCYAPTCRLLGNPRRGQRGEATCRGWRASPTRGERAQSLEQKL